MADAEPGDPRVGDVLDELTATIAAVPVSTPAQEEFVGAEAQRLSEIVALRSERLDYADRGIPEVLWVALVVGGVVTVGFALLFGLQRALLHSLMVGSLAALVGVLFFVTLVINYPFAGDVAVEPEPFQRVLTDFGP